MKSGTTFGLVLAGGAARGAFGVGVLRYIYTVMPKRLGFAPWPQVISGTSVGALNGVFAAARLESTILRIAEVWREMQIEDVYGVRGGSVFRAAKAMFSAADLAGLLDPSPLYALVRREYPGAAIREAIDSGLCHAFIVSATQLHTGYNILFLDTRDQRTRLSPAPGSRVVRTQMLAEHLLASAALPLMFPPVKIKDDLFVDGGLRQNTPLRPLLRAGATRNIIVGAHVAKESKGVVPLGEVVPSLPFLAGKTLNALLLDPVERDLEQSERLNQIVDWGVEQYGPEFAEKLKQSLGFRRVHNLFIRPSHDLGAVASETFRTRPPKTSRQIRWLLSLAADQVNDKDSDLLSYLYFDREYTGTLERLGFEEAQGREEEIARLLLGE